MDIKIRKFTMTDIPYKVKWINDVENNQYLHYDLPLSEEKTLLWYKTLQSRNDRIDYTIILNKVPVGLIGLLNIDRKNKKAEYYLCNGEKKYKRKGIAQIATDLLIKESHSVYNLKKIYLFTEEKNLFAQALFEKIGFVQEGLLRHDIIHDGKIINRFVYGLIIDEYLNKEENCGI